ncbi:MAG: alpha-1,3-mannosyltransferase family protein [Gemmatales bacterium]|nr:alpha-1,3-mannosyltransferase family protein [Gemmatales bacterium]MDW8387255.1 hypothetical protein [Gemmatales bacterium]
MAQVSPSSARPGMTVNEMIQLIENAPPGPWPAGWASWPNVNEAHRVMARRFADSLKPSRHPYPEDRGIVIAGGGLKYFPSVWVCIHLIRHLGCKLPIQLWYLGDSESDPYMNIYEDGCLNHFASCASMPPKLEQDTPCQVLCGWESKPYIMLHLPFAQASSVPRY